MTISNNARALIEKRLHAHRIEHWPALTELSIRHRGDFN